MSKKNEDKAVAPIPMSTEIARKGINTDSDFAAVFSALIGDTLSGAINPNVTNAACNSAGKLLKMFELRHKYGAAAGQIRFDGEMPCKAEDDPRSKALAKLTPEERKALGL